MKLAVYPGSFDPVTLGHLDIIVRASKIFDKLIVGVPINPDKHASFSVEERMELLRRATQAEGLANVEIDKVDGLLADYAKRRGAMVVVKGLRALSDFEYEFQQALTNKKLNPELETMFLATSAENMFLSSSMVKQVAGFGGDISPFVPACILEAGSPFRGRTGEEKKGMGSTMSNNQATIEDLIDEMYDLLDKGWKMPLSAGKMFVDGEEVRQILDEIKEEIPSEVRKAKAIVADRAQILDEAQREAETIIRVAEEKAKAMVNQDEIVRQAQQKANELIAQAQQKFKEMRKASNDYVDDLMRRADESLSENLAELRKTRQSIKASQRNSQI